MSIHLDGARAGIVDVRPSIDLAWLMGRAHEALKTSLAEHPDMVKVGRSRDGGHSLVFDTRPFIAALLADADVSAKSSSAFLKDVAPPRSGRTLKIGGRFTPGTEASLKAAVRRIAGLVDEAIAEAFGQSPIGPADLWTSSEDTEAYLASVARGLDGKFQSVAPFRMSGLRFLSTSDTRKPDEVARQFTSFEVVQPGNRLDDLIKAVGRYFTTRRRLDPEEVNPEVEAWLDRGSLPDSYSDGLVNFLDDEGLSRVRLSVSFRIMRALADAGEEAGSMPDFVRYVRRIDDLFTRLVEARSDTVHADLAKVFGPSGLVDLGSEMSKASFCRRLPIWAVWKSQLFERRSPDAGGSGVQREVCYHFKVNGHNPSENERAFVARVESAGDLLGDAAEMAAGASLGELLVYDAVLTDHDVDSIQAIHARCERMRGARDRQAAVAELVHDLKAKEAKVERAAHQMIEILRRRATDRRLSAITREPVTFYVNLTDEMVNKNAVGANLDHPFVPSTDAEDMRIKWLRSLRITSEVPHPATNLLFSFRVRIEIGDRSLVVDGSAAEARAERSWQGRMVLLNLLPETEDAELRRDVYGLAADWRAGRNAITVRYDPSGLACRGNPKRIADPKAAITQMLAVRTAFMGVVQVFTERLVDMMAPDPRRDRVILFRQQLYPKSRRRESWLHSSEAIFTISQALEHALGKKLNVRLQGYVAERDRSSGRRKRKCFDAIMAGLDLAIDGLGSVPAGKVGIVSFASRPCDVDESKRRTEQDTYVVVGRVYLVEADGNGHAIRRRPNILDTYEGTEAVTNPSVVKEAVQGLVDEGCSHIVMMAHKYAGRMIGRSAERHRHHQNAGFLGELARTFPNTTFHPVVKDAMKVVRLSDDRRGRVGFEVVGRERHADRLVGENMREAFNKEGLIPFYSLATLHHVRTPNERGERPQSGVATYYLLKPDSAEGLDILIGSVGLLETGSPAHISVVSAIRGIHLIESEEGAMGGYMKPVLQPAAWMSPADINGAGEIRVMDRSRRSRGTVEVSLTAVAAALSRVLGAMPSAATAGADANG
jgi:hypothetical protein